jgi:hypothetical protein
MVGVARGVCGGEAMGMLEVVVCKWRHRAEIQNTYRHDVGVFKESTMGDDRNLTPQPERP